MKKKISGITLFTLVIVASFLLVYGYYGGFKSVKVKVEEQGGELLLYKEVVGDYSRAAAVMDSIQLALFRKGIVSKAGFGIYYDNPRTTEVSLLRSEVGFILSNPDTAIVAQLSRDFRIKSFPRNKYLTSVFPYKGRLSIIVGIVNVYPAMNSYLKEKNMNDQGFVMEIYDLKAKKIEYRKQLL
ncbi:MAG: GyrI-like domain-containing protein [Dysgonomonas sp.]